MSHHHFHCVAFCHLVRQVRALDEEDAVIDGVAEENASEGLRDDAANPRGGDDLSRLLAGGAATEIISCHDNVALGNLSCQFRPQGFEHVPLHLCPVRVGEMLGGNDDVRVDVVTEFPHPSCQNCLRFCRRLFTGARRFCASDFPGRFLFDFRLRHFRIAQRNPARQRRLDGFVSGRQVNRPAGVAFFVVEIIGNHELCIPDPRLVPRGSALIQHQPAGLHDVRQITAIRRRLIHIGGARRHREPHPRRHLLPFQRLRRKLHGFHGAPISAANPHRLDPLRREFLDHLPISYIDGWFYGG